jgi:hypothetical protein
MPSPRTLITTAALGAALVAPGAAHAAEGFTVVTSGGNVTHLQSDAIPSEKPVPIKVTGLAAGERIVGMDRAPSGELLALTSAGRIDALNAATGKATPKFANPVTAAVDRNAALTFAVAPDGASARIITQGRDVTVNLATGVAVNGTGLTFAPGDAHAGVPATPALDYGKDGRLIGAVSAQSAFAVQTALGAPTISTLGPVPYSALEPLRTTVASDGAVWVTSRLGNGSATKNQSRLVRYDPATGHLSGQNGIFLSVKLAAIADDGPVADDTTKPKATFSHRVLTRRVVHGHSIYRGLKVKMNEGGQAVASLRYHGKIAGFGLITLDSAGSATLELGPTRAMGATLRKAAAAHKRAIVHIAVHDWAQNKRSYDVAVRLSS